MRAALEEVLEVALAVDNVSQTTTRRWTVQEEGLRPTLANPTAPPPPPVTTNVSELEAEVSRLRAQLAARSNPSRDSRPEGPVLKRQCRREEFVPQCDEEMEEWLAGRHADLQTALATGQLLEVARLSQLMTNSCRGVASIDSKPENSSFSVAEHSEVTMHHISGRGITPRSKSQRKASSSSSDDELLSQPMEGRDVIPRTDNSGSNRFAILAHVENVPDGTPELEEAVVRRVSLDRDQVRAESLLDALEVDLQRPGPPMADSEFRSQHHCPGVASDLATTQMSSTMPASTVPASTVPASSRALCEAFSGGLLPVEVPLSVPGLASTQRDSSEDDVPLSSLGRTRQRFLEATQWDSGAEFSFTRASGFSPTTDVLVPGNSSTTRHSIRGDSARNVRCGRGAREDSFSAQARPVE